jgi:hypothetical protein
VAGSLSLDAVQIPYLLRSGGRNGRTLLKRCDPLRVRVHGRKELGVGLKAQLTLHLIPRLRELRFLLVVLLGQCAVRCVCSTTAADDGAKECCCCRDQSREPNADS